MSKYKLTHNNQQYITLRFWCQENALPYENFKEKACNNEPGFLVTDTRYWVLADQPVPEGYSVTCAVCGKNMSQITVMHLKTHDMTVTEYVKQFPNNPIYSEITTNILKENAIKNFNNDEAREKGKLAIQETFKNGRVTHNKGVTGVYFASDESKQKMSIANKLNKEKRLETSRKNKALGLHKPKGPISEQGLENIRNGVKNRKPLTEEQMQRLIERCKEQFTGVPKSAETREKIRIATIERAINNPDSFKTKYFNTKPEQEFKALCEKHNIECIHQFHTKNPTALYDFYLPKFNIVVEIDGPIHWNKDYYVHKKAIDQEESFLAIQSRDLRKNEIAAQHGLRVLRIKVIYNLNDYEKAIDQVMKQNLNELLFLFE